jgi:hypothetical protein
VRITSAEYETLRFRQAAKKKPAAIKGKRGATRKERDIQRAILDAAKLWKGVRLWKTGGGLLPLADGRRVRMGVVGVSDLVGWRQLQVYSSHPEQRWWYVAQIVAIEVKRPGRHPTQEQAAFLKAVEQAGGLAIVARSVSDVARALGLE